MSGKKEIVFSDDELRIQIEEMSKEITKLRYELDVLKTSITDGLEVASSEGE